MRNEFSAIVEQDGEWFVAYRSDVTGANGQGRTRDEALQNLSDAVALILLDRREAEIDSDATKGVAKASAPMRLPDQARGQYT